MRTLLITAALALGGCAQSVAELREQPPFIAAASAKSAPALAQCFGEAWQRRSGLVNSIPVERGLTMTLSYSAMGQVITAAVIDVREVGDRSAVVVHARKGDAGDKLRGEVEGCL